MGNPEEDCGPLTHMQTKYNIYVSTIQYICTHITEHTNNNNAILARHQRPHTDCLLCCCCCHLLWYGTIACTGLCAIQLALPRTPCLTLVSCTSCLCQTNERTNARTLAPSLHPLVLPDIPRYLVALDSFFCRHSKALHLFPLLTDDFLHRT